MPAVVSAAAFLASLVVGAPVVALKVAGVFLLNLAASKLFGPKVPGGVGLGSLQVMGRGALEFRKIVYGQALVSGPVVYNNVSGGDNEYLWYVVPLCDGLSEDITAVHFDGEAIPKADIDWAAGTGASDGTGTGDVSTARWVGDNSTAAVQIYYYQGDDLQPVSGDLNAAFAAITTNHRLRGVTYLVVQLLYNVDTEDVWQTGQPSDIKALVKGRLIYDPRLDSTNGGSGAHRYTDSTTWAWSDNPALCIADYLFNVMAVAAATGIDWPAIITAADDCDALVVVPPAASPENTETRFTCNGALSLGQSHKDNLDALLSSCAGSLAYTAGQWKLRASVWEASSVTLDESDLAGAIQIRGTAPKAARFNTVRGFFVDPARHYQSVEFPHVASATFITRDGGEVITHDAVLPMTNSVTMAQRIGIRYLFQSDNQTVANVHTNVRGVKASIGDRITFSLADISWSSKLFRCIEWVRNPDSSCKLTMQEDSAASYADPIVTDYTTGFGASVTVPADIVPPPTGLTATAVPVGIQLDWVNPPAATFDFIDVYEDTNDSWAGAVKIARVRADTFTVSHDSGTSYFYWVRAIRLPALESLRNPDNDTTTITAAGTGGADGDTGATGAAGGDGLDGTASLMSGRQSNDLTEWWASNNQVTPLSASIWSTLAVSGAPVWPDAIQVVENNADLDGFFSNRATIDPTKTYRVQLQARRTAGDRASYFFVSFFDSAGVNIDSAASDAVGWATISTYHYFESNINVAATWTIYSEEFGGGSAVTIPTGAVALCIGALGPGSGTTETTIQMQDFHCIELSDYAITEYLSNSAHVLDANFDGTGYSFTGSGGTHVVNRGVNDITTDVTHEIVGGTDGGANWTLAQNGLTLTVVEATGVYSLSGASWTTNFETFTLRAVFGGVNYDRVYTIAKARQGSDGGCAVATLTNISLSDVGVGGTRTVGFRVDADGDIYTRVSNAAGHVTKETWIGACANSVYECNYVHSGDTLTGGSAAVNTWHLCSTDRLFELQSTSGRDTAGGTLQIRRTADDMVVATVSVSLEVESSA